MHSRCQIVQLFQVNGAAGIMGGFRRDPQCQRKGAELSYTYVFHGPIASGILQTPHYVFVPVAN